MSYASVTGHNVPFGEMPKPDPNLAEGPTATDEAPAPAAPSEPPLSVELHPLLSRSLRSRMLLPSPFPLPLKDIKKEQQELKKKGKALKKEAKDEFAQAENALAPYWEKTKDVVLRPGTLGGLLGVVNVGILGTAGYFAYTKKNQPWDQRIVGGAVAGTLALFGAEGYLADSYLSTPEGQAEADRAKAEGSKLYLHAKEVVLRPQVAGGLVGAVNVAILSAVGYFSYQNWNRPWDRQIVGGVAAGLVALSGIEGWAGKKYKDEQL